MNITNFDDLLQAARAQPEPQRLLFVFAGAELPPSASAEQRRQFEAGEDELAPADVRGQVARRARRIRRARRRSGAGRAAVAIVFTAALAGRAGAAPTTPMPKRPLQRMVDAIKSGRIDGFYLVDKATVRFGKVTTPSS